MNYAPYLWNARTDIKFWGIATFQFRTVSIMCQVSNENILFIYGTYNIYLYTTFKKLKQNYKYQTIVHRFYGMKPSWHAEGVGHLRLHLTYKVCRSFTLDYCCKSSLLLFSNNEAPFTVASQQQRGIIFLQNYLKPIPSKWNFYFSILRVYQILCNFIYWMKSCKCSIYSPPSAPLYDTPAIVRVWISNGAIFFLNKQDLTLLSAIWMFWP